MTVRLLRYVGRDSLGRAASGALTGNPAAHVERYFKAGWQSVVISRDDVIVGRIEPAIRVADRKWEAFDDTIGAWVEGAGRGQVRERSTR